MFTVTFDECTLVRACRMKDKVVKAKINILLGEPDMILGVSRNAYALPHCIEAHDPYRSALTSAVCKFSP
jgi:hypothetical protein